MKIAVVGLGFVGLSMSTVIASKGIKTKGVEIDKAKFDTISKGSVPFYEPQVSELLSKTLRNQLEITNNLTEAVEGGDIIFICVGTPSNPDGSANLTFIKKVSNEIGQTLRKLDDFKVIVVKSTVPPSTTSKVVKTEIENASGKKNGSGFGLCMNPEFFKEGTAVNDMLFPHLIVIGVEDEKTKKIMHEFYEKMYGDDLPPLLDTSIINSELIKYANNSFLATKISFINTIANICNELEGADVEVIAKAIGMDPRIGPLFLKAGPGYGGSCFPKDLSGFLNFASTLGYQPTLLESTQRVNQDQPSFITKMIEKKVKNFSGKTISILGLSFTKNTDDIRESVSIKIVKSLLEKNARVKVHDPLAIENFRKKFDDKIEYCKKTIDCIKTSDCCVILTDWDEYGNLTEDIFKKNMNNPCVIDARRVLNPKKMQSIDYSAIGYGKKNN